MEALKNEIYIGSIENPDFYFVNDDIISVNGEIAADLVASELSIDTVTSEIQFEILQPLQFCPKDYDGMYSSDDMIIMTAGDKKQLKDVKHGTPVWYYNNGNYVGKFYVNNVKRTGVTKYKLTVFSILGLLAEQTFYGGVYSKKPFKELVKEVVLTDGLKRYTALDYAVLHSDTLFFARNNKFDGQKKFILQFSVDAIEEYPEDQDYIDLGLFGYINNGTTHDYKSFAIWGKVVKDSSSQWENEVGIYCVYNDYTSEQVKVQLGEKIEIILDGYNGIFSVNGTEQTFTPTSWETENQVYTAIGNVIEDLGTQTPIHKSKSKLTVYDVTMYSGTVKINEYIFAKNRLENDTIYMVDVITGYSTKSSGNVDADPGNEIQYAHPAFTTYGDQELEMWNSIDYDEGIAEYEITGWIPVCTKREALYQILFASSINLLKANDGTFLFTWIYRSKAETIADDYIFTGGSYKYDSLAKRVELTEHSFIGGNNSSITLYNNSDGESELAVVTFSQAPLYVNFISASSGLTCWAKNQNAAIVEGIGKLVNTYQYNHTTHVITKECLDNVDGNTVKVTDATLVNVSNSENVMKRLYDYYTSRQTISNDIIYNGEACGSHYAFTDPFRNKTDGYLSKITLTSSSFLKAKAEFITGYTPSAVGSNYTSSAILTGSGTFTVPDEVYEKDVPVIKVSLIGGGNGGCSGYKGKDGKSDRYATTGSAGGSAGPCGSGGKIFTFTLENPQKTFTYSCGTGGEGGAICYSEDECNEGAEGTATTFYASGEFYTSADGESVSKGIHNFFNGKTYGATPGSEWTSYRSGGKGGYNDGTYYWNGGNYQGPYTTKYYTGGVVGERTRVTGSGWWIEYIGGYGGGASDGENGGDGSANTLSGNSFRTGDGGKGADAVAVPQLPTDINESYLGWGGFGGAGGGAGGNCGYYSWATSINIINGNGGTGGYGGKGGKGAEGCIMIYW